LDFRHPVGTWDDKNPNFSFSGAQQHIYIPLRLPQCSWLLSLSQRSSSHRRLIHSTLSSGRRCRLLAGWKKHVENGAFVLSPVHEAPTLLFSPPKKPVPMLVYKDLHFNCDLSATKKL
jgi:hypothetical protein